MLPAGLLPTGSAASSSEEGGTEGAGRPDPAGAWQEVVVGEEVVEEEEGQVEEPCPHYGQTAQS